MKLISMTDFVLEQTKINQFRDDCEFAYPVRKYAKFLKQPLQLWMFVPCDENENVLEAPQLYFEGGAKEYLKLQKEYQQAKERCLFEGFIFDFESKYTYYLKLEKGISFSIHKKIESNIEYCIKYNLQLTQTAIKQLNL